jgi:precorrin-6B methylase 2
VLREGGVVTFGEAMKARRAEVNAEFVLPLISDGARVLDCGAGSATISVELALARPSSRVTAVD